MFLLNGFLYFITFLLWSYLFLWRSLIFLLYHGGNPWSEMILRANKGIGLITRLRRYLRRNSLLTIYKALNRPHLDYGDVVYDYPGNASFTQKLESVQYNASLAIAGCFRGTSRDKLYSELGLESLADRWFYGRQMLVFQSFLNMQNHFQSWHTVTNIAWIDINLMSLLQCLDTFLSTFMYLKSQK